ncbi:hypothetical protein CEUSTIGMA_g1462.t1 [Chlamydomonas eustigma]|uniref:Uncharacterized protein n=1 Tax=Chlamydomonas eustigma TaxID=1157962 RepID=A0A250WTQ1_9CHLO|nr:hypothetical protein CEUSTIGMA_g1462.t1 [Chlamydomonas eustigma]|eukprot:GAX74012.1 hypothetical protein CEUSTIGMA_g1462.t1 [Chlamydomonas eustigma]
MLHPIISLNLFDWYVDMKPTRSSASEDSQKAFLLVIVAHVSGLVTARALHDGKQAWTLTLDGLIFATMTPLPPLTANRKQFCTFLVPTSTGTLYCVDVSKGQVKWRTQLDFGPISAPAAVHVGDILSSMRMASSADPSQTIATSQNQATRASEYMFVPDSRHGSVNALMLAVTSNSGVVTLKRLVQCQSSVAGEKEEYELLLEEQLSIQMQGETFSPSVFVNGRLFLGCRDDHFYCIKCST